MKDLVLLVLTLTVVLAARWCLLPHGHLPRFRVRYLRLRLLLRLHPGRGHATVLELWWRWGRFAAFGRSHRTRPAVPAWQRAACAGEYSIRLGRAQLGHALRIPLDEHVLVMAPPRTGKTGLLAAVILRYPGPVVSTTTKHDVYQLTSGVRAGRGPVHVFNPQRIGGVASTFRWNPVDGCADEATAIRRADAFANAVSLRGTEDSSFWTSKASGYLRALFHAAALAGGDMLTVAAWALGDAGEAEDLLAQAGAVQWALELAELRGEAQKTAQTIRMVISRALAFLTDPSLAACVLPGGGDAGFSIGRFLRERGTVYLIASSDQDDSPVAPLFACLAGEIHHAAALAGQASPGGRLDPPLLMALDEIVQTCPVPLPSWLADSGGKGIQLIPVAHGEAQLRSRWQQDGAQAVLDTCGVKVFLPGITDTATLKMASELCGQACFTERERGGHPYGHRWRYRRARYRIWHDVLTPHMIRQLPGRHALIIRGSAAPVIGRLAAAWTDPRYKAYRRRGLATAALPPAPEAPPDPPYDPPGLPPARPAWPHGLGPALVPGNPDRAGGHPWN
jgi:type IV secretory pathway TraG/TraD family ATPase VirD4